MTTLERPKKLWIAAGLEQPARLKDGHRVVLRAIQPSDKEHLRDGLQKMSPESRYRRFLSATTTLSEAALRYLTEVDGWNHVAVVALERKADGSEEGLGVARFVRASDDPHAAEAAVTVLDAVQGQGLGRLLLAALTVGAVERGINVFRGELLSSNKPVMELMKELDPGLTIRVDGTITRIEARLPTEVPRPDDLEALRHAPANQLLRLAARGVEFKSPMPGH